MIRHKIYQILIIIFALTLSACEETFVEAFGVENPSGEVDPPQYSNFTCFKTLNGHSSFVNSVAYSPDGKKIVSGSQDKTVKIWGEN
ncbi:MAG: WD40 repeat domain-containing protein [Bacteroidales bacterium]|nr:WD40 repeat domain-containing protein [Bacteroidales bacterium]MEE1323967.1 WD40 repeat domain-containing protein [Bacteroidales bacterium]